MTGEGLVELTLACFPVEVFLGLHSDPECVNSVDRAKGLATGGDGHSKAPRAFKAVRAHTKGKQYGQGRIVETGARWTFARSRE